MNPVPAGESEWDVSVTESVGAVDGPIRPIRPFRARRLALGLSALALVGVLVGRSLLFGGSGASSPEGAVSALASAIADEDLVAALATLVPEEVQPLVAVYGDATSRADALGLSAAGQTFAGVDLRIEDLQLAVEPVGDDLAKVRIRRGTLKWAVDGAQLDDRLGVLSPKGSLSETWPRSGSISASDLGIGDRADVGAGDQSQASAEDRDPFVMVLRRDGGWYVSPAYTAAEIFVVSTGTPRADLNRPTDERSVAPTPSDAVRRLVASVNQDDVSAGIATMSTPEWAVLRTYRDALADVVGDLTIGRNQALQIDELTLDEERLDPTHVKVRITAAAGTIRQDLSRDYFLYPESTTRSIGPGEPRSAPIARTRTWGFDGHCLRVDGEPEACVGDPVGRLSFGRPMSLVTVESPFVIVVPERGGWAISPVSTVASYLSTLVASFGPDDLIVLAGREAEQTPTVDLPINAATPVDVGGRGYGVATVVVPGGSVVSVTGSAQPDEDFTLRVYRSPDDPHPLTTHLPTDAKNPALLAPVQTTTYRVVVADHRGSDQSVLLQVTDVAPTPLILGVGVTGQVEDDPDTAVYFSFDGVQDQTIRLSTILASAGNGSDDNPPVDGAGELTATVLDVSNGEPVLGRTSRTLPTTGRYVVRVIRSSSAEAGGGPIPFALAVAEVEPTFWESGASTVTVVAVGGRDTFVNVKTPGHGRFRVSGTATDGSDGTGFVLSGACGVGSFEVAADGRSVEIEADPPRTECYLDVVVAPSSPPTAITLAVVKLS